MYCHRHHCHVQSQAHLGVMRVPPILVSLNDRPTRHPVRIVQVQHCVLPALEVACLAVCMMCP